MLSVSVVLDRCHQAKKEKKDYIGSGTTPYIN